MFLRFLLLRDIDEANARQHGKNYDAYWPFQQRRVLAEDRPWHSIREMFRFPGKQINVVGGDGKYEETFLLDTHEYFMRQALKMAQIGLDSGELPIGAVVVLNGEIIAAAHTRERAEGRLLVHADLLALEAADRLKPFPGRRRDAKLYVTGEPCLMCLGAAMSFFLGEIYFGHECPGDGAVALVQQWKRKEEDFPNYRVPEIVGGVLRQDGIALFQEYVERHSSGAIWEWAKTIAAL